MRYFCNTQCNHKAKRYNRYNKNKTQNPKYTTKEIHLTTKVDSKRGRSDLQDNQKKIK